MAMGLEPEAVRAPELRGAAWLNTTRPLTLADLRGKLVLLDFWTYCCINCLHVMDDLKYLEDKYAGQPFAVIGVHSPKFANEEDLASVRQAVLRYGISHPVLLDTQRRTWDAYAVRGWPTLVLVDPRGYILGRVSGEGHRAQLDRAIGMALPLLGEAQALDDRPLPVRLERDAGALPIGAPLLFPGKVLADPSGERLFIADSGHHRVLLASLTPDGLSATAIVTYGAGTPGALDGDAEHATFHAPQGLALDAAHDWLYVADTGNHLIRRIDLASGAVTTVAGTGMQGQRAPTHDAPALATPLNSPWDVCLLGSQLALAMAGLHQIWAYDDGQRTLRVLAGSGAEGRADGPGAVAALAQPSGLSTDGTRLYVADSEISAIRELTFDATLDAGGAATVTTLAGGDLFLFGAHDGVGDAARFQHPLGVAWMARDALYVADSYNHRLRQIDTQTRAVTTVVGAEAGYVDGDTTVARFDEPSGISVAHGRLYVADTNNHAVRVVTFDEPGADAQGRVTTLRLPGLCAPDLCLPG